MSWCLYYITIEFVLFLTELSFFFVQSTIQYGFGNIIIFWKYFTNNLVENIQNTLKVYGQKAQCGGLRQLCAANLLDPIALAQLQNTAGRWLKIFIEVIETD